MSEEKPMSNYELLELTGFSPIKALEITIDAARGDKYALAWIKACRKIHSEKGETTHERP